MKVDPIYIIGSERSGTNLLRRLIANHQNIDGPLSPHLINTFYNELRFYGDLEVKENCKRLFQNMVAVCNHPFSDWKIKTDFETFFDSNAHDFVSILNFLYALKTEQSGKKRYISKELNAHFAMHALIEKNPGAKFLHLVRDPREQVASWMKTPLFFVSPYDAVMDWIKKQTAILHLQYLHPGSVVVVRYEDIVSNTTETIQSLLQTLEEPLDENCFQTQASGEKTEWNELWKNLNKPVGNDLQKHRKTLSLEDVQMIEKLAGNLMQDFNYIPYTNGNWKETRVFKIKKLIKSKIKAQQGKKVKGVELTRERTRFATEMRNTVRKSFYAQKKA